MANSTVEIKTKNEIRTLYILSAVFPIIIFGSVLSLHGVYPFGTRQIVITDFYQQYYPFLSDFWHKLHEGTSLLWSWTAGAGHEYVSHIAYYMASPLNLLTVLFPHNILRETLTAILIIKIGFAGLFMSMYLRYSTKRCDMFLPGFASMYALCAYTLGYYWNIMWFDTFALLPLVMLGVHKLVSEGKYHLFVLSLAAAVFFNYYIGLFVCIFTAILFCVLCFAYKLSMRQILLKIAVIAVCSALAIGMTAVFTVPSYNALQSSFRGEENAFPGSLHFPNSFTDVIGNFIAFTPPTTRDEKLPNLYSGMICVMLLPVFLVSRKISRREKSAYIIVALFLILSCNVNVLDYIWNGFNITNMLPFRFSFLVTFLLVVMAYKVYPIWENIKKSDIVAMGTGAAFFLLTALSGKQNNKHVLFSTIICAIYLALMFASIGKKGAWRRALKPFFLAAMLAELSLTTYVSFGSAHTTDRTTYPYLYEEVQEILDARKSADNDFYRTEFTRWWILNDSSLYGYNGISLFSSSVSVHVNNFIRDLGLPAWDRANRYYYAETSPLSNAFLNIRYLMDRHGNNADGGVHWDRVHAVNNSVLLENNRYLPLGFMVNEETAEFKGGDDNPFITQNDLFLRATGLYGDLFTIIDMKNVAHTNYDVRRKELGNYTFKKTDSSTEGTFRWNYEAPVDGNLFVYCKIDGARNAKVLLSNKSLRDIETDRPYIFTAGKFSQGNIVSITAESSSASGSALIYAAYLNRELFDRGYALLADETLKLDKFSETEISGQVNVLKDGLLYTSIPHGNYWKAYVDGSEAEIVTINGAMAALRLNEGKHSVEFRYHNSSLTAGVIISLISLLLFLTLIMLNKFKRWKVFEEVFFSVPEDKIRMKR